MGLELGCNLSNQLLVAQSDLLGSRYRGFGAIPHFLVEFLLITSLFLPMREFVVIVFARFAITAQICGFVLSVDDEHVFEIAVLSGPFGKNIVKSFGLHQL